MSTPNIMSVVRIYNIEPKYRRYAVLELFKKVGDEIANIDVLADSTIIVMKSPGGAHTVQDILSRLAYPDTQLKSEILHEKPSAKPGNEVEFSNLPLQYYDFDLKQLIAKFTSEDPSEQFYEQEYELRLNQYGNSQFCILRAYDKNFALMCQQQMNRQYVSYLDMEDCQIKLQMITVKARTTADGVQTMGMRRSQFHTTYGLKSKSKSDSQYKQLQQQHMSEFVEKLEGNEEQFIENALKSSQNFMDSLKQSGVGGLQ